MSEQQTYNLAKLSEDQNFTFELATISNAIVPISLKALSALNPACEGKRAPTVTELVKLASVCLGQSADPYSNECGLLPVFSGGFHYEVWVAAQVRMRKAQAQADYRGYRWGWITSDMKRHESGRASTASPADVVGAWGEVFREGNEPFYHEVFMDEYKKSDKGSWGKTPLTMLAKVIRDQTHKFSYADKMGNLSTADELQVYDQPSTDIPDCKTRPRAERRQVVSTDVTPQGTTTPLSETESATDAEDSGSPPLEDEIPFGEPAAEPVEDDNTLGSKAALAMIAGVRDNMLDMFGMKDCEKPNALFVQTCAHALACPETDCNKPAKFSVAMLKKVNDWVDNERRIAK